MIIQEELNQKNIDLYALELKKNKDKTTPFEYFNQTLFTLIDPYEIASINENFHQILQTIEFENLDEANSLLLVYNGFHNSVVGFIQQSEIIEDDKKFEKLTSNILDAFLKYENKKSFTKKFDSIIDKFLAKVFDVYEIEINEHNTKTNNDLIAYLSSIFGNEDIALQMISLMHISMDLNQNNSFDLKKIKVYFSLYINFVTILNSMRQTILENIEDQKEFLPRREKENIVQALQDPQNMEKVGRNEPCPCGSGKKYKKCCMNKKAVVSNPLDELDIPMAKHLPLSKKAIDGFYSLWSRFVNFANKELCEKRGTPYQKLYFKDEEDKYTLNEYAMKENYYFEVRNFILINFNSLVELFIETTKLSLENIDTLNEWKEYRLQSSFCFIYEKMPHGAIVWDMESKEYYYVYDLYSSIYDLSTKDKPMDMLLLPYKGRIIYDGVIGHGNVNFGSGAAKSFLEEYCTIRKENRISEKLPKQSSTTKILQLRIDIAGAKPPIWRRVLIPDTLTYQSFHYLIQDLFDWEDAHLYDFKTRSGIYTEPDDVDELSLFANENKNAADFVIGEDLIELGDTITYTYDFGDNWEHKIVLEEIKKFDENEVYPKCIKGKNSGPLEDIGGIYAYNEIVQAIKHNDIDTLLFKYGLDETYDPTYFKIKEINEIISEYR